jgi:hypothetical protein
MPIRGSDKLFRFAAGGLFRIQRWSAVVALLEVPRQSRAVICLVLRVVSVGDCRCGSQTARSGGPGLR